MVQIPFYTGIKKLPCPESVDVLVKWLESGYINDSGEGRNKDNSVEINGLKFSGGEIKGNGMVDDRGDHELLVLNSNISEITRGGWMGTGRSIVVKFEMEARLERFKNPSKCFEIKGSDSGKTYGIFLRK